MQLLSVAGKENSGQSDTVNEVACQGDEDIYADVVAGKKNPGNDDDCT